jgi:hypothetical protein
MYYIYPQNNTSRLLNARYSFISKYTKSLYFTWAETQLNIPNFSKTVLQFQQLQL